MLFPISHIYEKETRKQQQTNEKDNNKICSNETAWEKKEKNKHLHPLKA